MTKYQFFEYKIQTSLVETSNYDFIAMGRPEGPGCYCYANNLLRDILKIISNNYEFLIIDNEAGMEHLSRRTTQNIDVLLIISDPVVRGIRTASKISHLVNDLKTRVKDKYLILNRINESIPQAVIDKIAQENLKLLDTIPEDKNLLQLDQEGKAIWDFIDQLSTYQTIGEIMNKLGLGKETKDQEIESK
jgi:CO dehydrogenase maturation factor